MITAYQVFKGDNDKHDRQTWELIGTYLNKDKAEELAHKIVNDTPLYGDKLIDEGWGKDESYRVWSANGWDYVGICKIKKIEITE